MRSKKIPRNNFCFLYACSWDMHRRTCKPQPTKGYNLDVDKDWTWLISTENSCRRQEVEQPGEILIGVPQNTWRAPEGWGRGRGFCTHVYPLEPLINYLFFWLHPLVSLVVNLPVLCPQYGGTYVFFPTPTSFSDSDLEWLKLSARREFS